ncbi:unnamed protein product [Polarella glacialis]|uniref:Uncharacterized protein n=1 Tax=Polarella glacialis TaxID=89957 RepID=A0A813HB51_POLGL|nr:unnamed protein product [Polarella glacialis]
MVNSNSDDAIGTLWDQETNTPGDLDIEAVHSKVQDWQQKARQAGGDPHFFGKYARNGADYMHIWAMYGLILNKLAHGTVNGVQVKKVYTAHLLEDMNLITGLGKWAGPFYEQGILSLLDAYETEGAYYGRLPGEFGFMHNILSADCLDENREDDEGPTMMVPVNVHGFSDPAKKLLKRLSSTIGWWDVQESMEGRENLRPCFLFHRIVETETASVYEFRANEGTVIRAKIPKGMYYKRTRDTKDPRGEWVAGHEVSCSLFLTNFVSSTRTISPSFMRTAPKRATSRGWFLRRSLSSGRRLSGKETYHQNRGRRPANMTSPSSAQGWGRDPNHVNNATSWSETMDARARKDMGSVKASFLRTIPKGAGPTRWI